MGTYQLGMACLNGHTITGSADTSPEFRSKFCGLCGAETVTQCQHCNAPIRGNYYSPGVLSLSGWDPDAYCYECGAPYPWTEGALDAAAELIEEADSLDDSEKEALKGALPDLVRSTPRTEVSILRYKKLAAKAGGSIAGGLGNIIVNVATEAAKKALGL